MESCARVSGYRHAAYADALSEFGSPLHLPGCDGWLLASPISDLLLRDARGCYPLFACQDWSKLAGDLQQLDSGIVSLVLVTDPFGNHTPDFLSEIFPDLCRPYKHHFVIDLQQSPDQFISTHHARNVRKAVEKVTVELCEQPAQWSSEWIGLYGHLIGRHQIKGISAFSETSLAKQLEVPGMVLFRAVAQGQTIGMISWYVQEDVGYYHLAAYTDPGYELKASFALFGHSITFFASRLRWLNLGAGAGVHATADDGLTRFKRGWSTGTRPAYLCGRIFDRRRYDELVAANGLSGEDFFPLYRKGEIR